MRVKLLSRHHSHFVSAVIHACHFELFLLSVSVYVLCVLCILSCCAAGGGGRRAFCGVGGCFLPECAQALLLEGLDCAAFKGLPLCLECILSLEAVQEQ